MKTVMLLTAMLCVSASVWAGPTMVKSHDYWIDMSGVKLGLADPDTKTMASEAWVIVPGACDNVIAAVAEREVCLMTGTGTVIKVLKSYFVAVPLAGPGAAVPQVQSTLTGASYIPFKKVVRCVRWDAEAGAPMKGWKWCK